jgi:histone H4
MALRHRKVLRDNIQGITAPAIRRLCRRGGVKRISQMTYEETRGVLKVFLENVIRDTVTYSEHARMTTVRVLHVVHALKMQGRPLYGMDTVHSRKRKPVKVVQHQLESDSEDGVSDHDDDDEGPNDAATKEARRRRVDILKDQRVQSAQKAKDVASKAARQRRLALLKSQREHNAEAAEHNEVTKAARRRRMEILAAQRAEQQETQRMAQQEAQAAAALQTAQQQAQQARDSTTKDARRRRMGLLAAQRSAQQAVALQTAEQQALLARASTTKEARRVRAELLRSQRQRQSEMPQTLVPDWDGVITQAKIQRLLENKTFKLSGAFASTSPYVKSCADLEGLRKLNVPGDGDCGPHSLRVLKLASAGRVMSVETCRKLLIRSMGSMSAEFEELYRAAVAVEDQPRWIADEEVAIAMKSGLFMTHPVNVMMLEEYTSVYTKKTASTVVKKGKQVRGNIVYNSVANTHWIFVCMTGGTRERSSHHFQLLCRLQEEQDDLPIADTPLQFVFHQNDSLVQRILTPSGNPNLPDTRSCQLCDTVKERDPATSESFVPEIALEEWFE